MRPDRSSQTTPGLMLFVSGLTLGNKMKRSTKLGLALVALMGAFMLAHGTAAHYRGEVWASRGGSKSGPMTPGAEILTGAILVFAVVWAAATSGKEEE
jgi:hypothetical protein